MCASIARLPPRRWSPRRRPVVARLATAPPTGRRAGRAGRCSCAGRAGFMSVLLVILFGFLPPSNPGSPAPAVPPRTASFMPLFMSVLQMILLNSNAELASAPRAACLPVLFEIRDVEIRDVEIRAVLRMPVLITEHRVLRNSSIRPSLLVNSGISLALRALVKHRRRTKSAP